MSAGAAGAGGSSSLEEQPGQSAIQGMAAVFDAMQDGITIQATDGSLVYANDAAARACGFENGRALVEATGEEALARFTILDPEGNPVPYEALPGRQALEGEPSPRQLLRYRNQRTGEERWAEVNATPLFDDEDTVRFAVNVLHDVTQLKETEAALRRARRGLEDRIRKRTRDLSLLRRLIDASTDGVFVVDPDTGRFEDVNRTAAQRLGYTPDELAGMRLANVREDLGDPAAWTAFVEAARGRGGALVEGVHRRKDGTTFPVEANVQIVDEQGTEHLIAITRDITDRKRTEAELRRSNRELTDFAHVVSHDLKEPLRVIAGYLDALGRRHGDELSRDAIDMLRRTREGADQMKRMIDALLTYARVDTSGQRFSSVNLDETLADAVEHLRVRIEASAATVTADDLPVVTAVPHQMAQLIQNLLSNALKFHRPGVPPRVHVGAHRREEGWEIRVEDNGIGIDPAHSEDLFRAFHRLGGAEDVEGTGIGLAICRRVVEAHGGTIEADPRPGHGTVFRAWLPDEPPK